MTDALGLSVFTFVGAYVALGEGVHPVVAVLMGAVTGTVGGMIRDLLCGDVPFILRREIYVTASLAGGAVYVLLVGGARVDTLAAMLAGVVFTSRMVGALWGAPTLLQAPADQIKPVCLEGLKESLHSGRGSCHTLHLYKIEVLSFSTDRLNRGNEVERSRRTYGAPRVHAELQASRRVPVYGLKLLRQCAPRLDAAERAPLRPWSVS